MKKIILGFLIAMTSSVALAINTTIPQAQNAGDIPYGNSNGTYSPSSLTTLNNSWLTTKTTDNLTEGLTNFYFTNDRVGSVIYSSSTIPKTNQINAWTGQQNFTNLTSSTATTSTLAITGLTGIPYSNGLTKPLSLATSANIDSLYGYTPMDKATTTLDGMTRINTTLGTPAGAFLAVNPSGTIISTTTPTSGGTPGGNSGEIQYNNGGSFGGNSGLTYSSLDDNSTLTISTFIGDAGLKVGGGSATTSVNALGVSTEFLGNPRIDFDNFLWRTGFLDLQGAIIQGGSGETVSGLTMDTFGGMISVTDGAFTVSTTTATSTLPKLTSTSLKVDTLVNFWGNVWNSLAEFATYIKSLFSAMYPLTYLDGTFGLSSDMATSSEYFRWSDRMSIPQATSTDETQKFGSCLESGGKSVTITKVDTLIASTTSADATNEGITWNINIGNTTSSTSPMTLFTEGKNSRGTSTVQTFTPNGTVTIPAGYCYWFSPSSASTTQIQQFYLNLWGNLN
jgi:hypothetical protein